MPIKCAQFENNTTTCEPDDHSAMVQISGSANGDDLAQDIVDQGTTVNKPDNLAVTAALKPACQRRVEQGSLDELCDVTSPGKTVSKLELGPAPSLALAVAPRPGLGIEVNLTADPGQPDLDPRSSWLRSEANLGTDRIPGDDSIVGRMDSTLPVVPTQGVVLHC